MAFISTNETLIDGKHALVNGQVQDEPAQPIPPFCLSPSRQSFGATSFEARSKNGDVYQLMMDRCFANCLPTLVAVDMFDLGTTTC